MKKFSITESIYQCIDKEEEFFNQPVVLSYFGLSKLLRTPILYYNHYILKQREDKQEIAMIEGKLIHCLLLTPERFEDEYVIALEAVPSENPRKVIDTVYNHYCILKQDGDEREELSDFGNAIIDVLTDISLYQNLKTDAQRIEKIIGVQKHLDYWEYLKQSKNKTLIDQSTYDFAIGAVEKIKSNSYIMNIMGFLKDIMDDIEVYNELELSADTEYSYSVRGIVDNMVIDHDNKVIRVNDLKKTSKHISDFKDSIEFYQYWMQAAMYFYLVNLQKDYPDYTIEVRFIVIDIFQQVGVYKASGDTLSKWYDKLIETFIIAEYHLVNRYFDLPYEFVSGNGEYLI